MSLLLIAVAASFLNVSRWLFSVVFTAISCTLFTAIPLAVAGAAGLAYSGTSPRVMDRQVRIGGELVSVASPTAVPGGTIGQFEIRGIDASYQANGTFAGDRQ